MHVSCPACDTVFRLEQALLEHAGGLVRCGCCGAAFDARIAGVPLPIRPSPDGHQGSSATPSRPGANARIPDAGRQTPPPDPELHPEQILGLTGELAEEERPPPPAWRGLLLGFGSILLLGLLGWQLVLGLRDPLLASPGWRPHLERGCAWLGCRLAPLRDADRVEIIARDIRTHPEYRNGLLVDVTFVNRAPFSQPFPVLQLTFTSLDEQWLAQRRFQPAEYLGLNRDAAERLPPDIPVQVVLELLDPGPEAVNFNFAFL